MTIHQGNPFADPDPDPVRRLRGRVTGAVSLWTAGPPERPAGLTVSSLLVVAGEPGRIVGMLDPDSDLAEQLVATGRGLVVLLSWRHRMLADAFAGVAPAPGGPFRLAEFAADPAGPRLVGADATAWVAVESTRPVGWSLEVTATLDRVELAEPGPGHEAAPLLHRRGRYIADPGAGRRVV